MSNRETLLNFVKSHRQAALAVAQSPAPLMAMIAYAMTPDGSPLIQLSNLSSHKKSLLATPDCSLLIMDYDVGTGDVMELQRLSLYAQALLIPKESSDYLTLKSIYLNTFPEAEDRFTLADFDLLKLKLVSGRMISGFGQILTVTFS